MSSIQRIRQFLKTLREEDVRFKKHFYDRVEDRPVSEGVIRRTLKRTDRLIKVEEQPSRRPGEEKYKLWFRLSNRYSLVVIAIITEKHLYIITAWNSDRKWLKSRQE